MYFDQLFDGVNAFHCFKWSNIWRILTKVEHVLFYFKGAASIMCTNEHKVVRVFFKLYIPVVYVTKNMLQFCTSIPLISKNKLVTSKMHAKQYRCI